ncbi:FtsQ-type POTRA domain-containing protein [Alkalibacter rhizosphaerae]|uniref:FtsQ-type POTRA domain-containing protein n=1 Tax=Alkalibacter rhizosphaerae TaxID=2815577 RepID=A0A975AIC0_9FIRM|nr:FtsQ-type POTRA domain-containing protein [Alkalibacter rhizosphaerae]QSX08918.1 FtsQ-type POTRA domain-containing protein [Alkalibacter rhizosphaerae]
MSVDGSQRRKEARIKKRRNVIRFLIVSLVLVGMGCLVFLTDIFLVRSIEFIDYEYLEENQLLERSELRVGEHILMMDTGQAAKNLNQLGYVKNTSIVRVFPNRIKVYITPREPAAILKWTEGYAYIDMDGVVAEKTKSPDRWDLVWITGLEAIVSKVDETDPFQTTPSWLGKDVLAALKILQKEDLLTFVAEINVTEDGQLHLYTKGESLIKTAGSENMKSKIDFLFTYLREKDDRMVIDLTHGGNPTFTPR